MDIVLNFLEYITLISEYNYFLSVFVFILLHVLLAIFFIPCSPMTTLAGMIWGPYGVIFALVASLLSGISTFLLSRYFLNGYFNHRYSQNKKYIWLSDMTKKHGWKIIAVTQLNPIVPSSTLGYLYGLSQIKLKDYIVYTFVFSLPLSFVLVFFGSSMIEVLKGDVTKLLISILIIIMAATVFKILKKKIKLREQ